MNTDPPYRIKRYGGVLLRKTYNIKFNGEIVGEAEIAVEGMYQRIRCRCQVPKNGRYKVQVMVGGRVVDLGLCVPYGEQIGTEKRIPKIVQTAGNLEFFLIQVHPLPLKPIVLPFSSLYGVTEGRFINQEGRGYLLIDEALTKQDNGQNP